MPCNFYIVMLHHQKNYIFNKKQLCFQRIKYYQEKHELQADYLIGGQIQHKSVKIQDDWTFIINSK